MSEVADGWCRHNLESACDECVAEYAAYLATDVENAERALLKRMEPDGSVCAHGQTFSCRQCFSESLAAWCPSSEPSGLFFGVDRRGQRIDRGHWDANGSEVCE